MVLDLNHLQAVENIKGIKKRERKVNLGIRFPQMKYFAISCFYVYILML